MAIGESEYTGFAASHPGADGRWSSSRRVHRRGPRLLGSGHCYRQGRCL